MGIGREPQNECHLSACEGELMPTNTKHTIGAERSEAGFSLVELLMSTVLSLYDFGVGVATFTGAIGRRERETSRTDALTSAAGRSEHHVARDRQCRLWIDLQRPCNWSERLH